MNGEKRRQAILDRLRTADAPISAGAFAAELGVSRQVIVQDIALLRAIGSPIASLARGYRMEKPSTVSRVFKLRHTDEEAERELELIVDAGGVVEDVYVSHRAYGKLRAEMNIRSRLDVHRFLEDIATGKSTYLKNVTSGYHYHTVTATSEEALDTIEALLDEAGLLAPLQPYEREENGF